MFSRRKPSNTGVRSTPQRHSIVMPVNNGNAGQSPSICPFTSTFRHQNDQRCTFRSEYQNSPRNQDTPGISKPSPLANAKCPRRVVGSSI